MRLVMPSLIVSKVDRGHWAVVTTVVERSYFVILAQEDAEPCKSVQGVRFFMRLFVYAATQQKATPCVLFFRKRLTAARV